MAFVKKTWTDRISEYPNRRTIDDGYTVKTVTVGRDEGVVTEVGDAFNASNMNDLEDRIDAAISGGGGASALDDLTDVDITSATVGQVLKYDGAKWVNGTGGGSSYTAGDNIDITSDVISVTGYMTAAEAHTLWASL